MAVMQNLLNNIAATITTKIKNYVDTKDAEVVDKIPNKVNAVLTNKISTFATIESNLINPDKCEGGA